MQTYTWIVLWAQGLSEPDSTLLQLHHRFVAGENSARDEIATILLSRLIDGADRRFPQVDPDLRFDAVIEELLFYLRNPSEFRPAEDLSLDRLIARRIRRRIGHLVRGAVRRHNREEAWAASFRDFEDPRYPD